MSQLCACPEGPRCEVYGGNCERPADWSFFTPPGRWIKTWPHGRFTFMCTPCRDYYAAAIKKPLKGIDRPEGADEDWRPSIMEHLRLSAIDAQINEQAERNRLGIPGGVMVYGDLSRPGDSKRYTPAQLKQVYVLRRYHRDNGRQAI